MFIGYYEALCSVKNQITFPSRFQVITGKKLLITNWFEKSLLVAPFELVEEMLEKVISEQSDLVTEVRDLERFFYGGAVTVALDKQNRFVLPANLKEYAGIGKDVVFVGVKNRIELWDKEMYINYGKIREVQIRQTAQSLYNLISQNKK